MTTAEPLVCHRCRRRITVQPVWWLGVALGTTCAKRYGIRPERPPRPRQQRRRRDTGLIQPVLDGLETNEINNEEEE